MVRAKVADPSHPEQGHGRSDLPAKDLGSLGHPALPAGHQPVEVGPPDEGTAGAGRDRGDDVRAGEDAAVEVDLGAAPHRSRTAGSTSSGVGCAVELAAAVVGDDDRVGAGGDDGAGVLQG